MADDGMDPCECLWNHELSMRRLLSLLRQGQSYCTDNECLEGFPSLGGATTRDDSGANSFLLMFLMMAMVMLLYVMRPRRNRLVGDVKPINNSNDNDGAPPNPPAIN